MPLLFWKHNRAIDNFAVQLADQMFSTVPPEMAADLLVSDENDKSGKSRIKLGGKKIKKAGGNAAKFDVVLNETISRVIDFRKRLKLGVYGKARLHMQFMSRLQDLGYSEELAKTINEEIMLRTP